MRYKLQSILPESAWPPSVGRKYVELALISQERCNQTCASVMKQQTDYTRGDYDKILQYKTKTNLKKAFGAVFCEGGTEIWPLRMLIDGAPGVGKTTLSRKVSRKWAKGKILQKYWLVLLLHLRERAISKAKSIDDFFYHDDPDIKHDVIKFVRKNSGDGMLIIFDGFDELSSYERSEESLFLDVSRGKILPKCAVVITSRPYASRTIQEFPSLNRHIEVLGFTDEQVKDCIRQKIRDHDKAEQLCMDLKERLDIASICQIPLNCSIVVYVYEQQNHCLPNTLTDLYDKFVLHTLKRFVKRSIGNRAANKLRKVEHLQDSSREHFKLLCNLAIKGLEADKLVFPVGDLEEIFPTEYQSDIDLPVLDLMTSAKSYSVDGGEDTYNFLHLTIQEFLAAYWLAHYSMDDTTKLEFYQKNIKNSRFRMVLLFLSGMTKLDFHASSSVFSEELWKGDLILVCHLCYESQNNSMCQVVSKKYCNSFCERIKLTGSRFETLVISSFLAYSNCCWAEFHLRPDDIEVVHKVFKGICSKTLIKKVIVSFGQSSTNLMLLTHLEELDQINEVGFSISINGGCYAADVKYDKDVISAFTQVLSALRNKHYSITLESSVARNNRNKVVTNFCEILGQGLIQNYLITEIRLNCVLPQDIKPIFKNLSKNHALERIVCKKINRRCSQLVREEESKEFCDILETFLSSNTSLKEINLDISLDSTTVSGYIDTVISRLTKNTTLQSLSLCPGVIAFERNEQTGKIEFKGVRTFEPVQPLHYTSGILESVESSSGKDLITDLGSLTPPAKRPCKGSPLDLLRSGSLSDNLSSSSTLTPSQTPAELSVSSQQGFRQMLQYASGNTMSVTIHQPQSMPPSFTSLIQPRCNVVCTYSQPNVSQEVIVTTQTSSSLLGTSITQYDSTHLMYERSNLSPVVTQSCPPHLSNSYLPAQYSPTQFPTQPSVNYFVNNSIQQQIPFGCWPHPYSIHNNPIWQTHQAGQTNFLSLPMHNDWQHGPMHQTPILAPSYMDQTSWPGCHVDQPSANRPIYTQSNSATTVVATTTSMPPASSC